MNPDWLIPRWPAPAQVHAVCSTRAGGVSDAPFQSFNLGDHVGDEPGKVAVNRGILQQAMGAQPVFLSQVHGTRVLQINASTPHGEEADACLADQPNLACTIMVADCLPVLLTHRAGTVVAAVHAGWRSLAGQGGIGVLEKTLASFRALALMDKAKTATEMIAWLGPCIGPDAFEVGDDVRDAMLAHDTTAQRMFRRHGADKWLADLQGLARLRLVALGVTQIHGNDGSTPWCTVANPSRFFSHRRDGVSGRMAAGIWMD